MKRQDVEIGMKVVVHSKSTGNPLGLSDVYREMKRKNQGFLYVAHQHADEVGVTNRFLLTADEKCIRICGDYFMCTDFEPYIEKDNK